MGRKQKAFGKRKHKNFKIALSKRMLKSIPENGSSDWLETFQQVNVTEGEPDDHQTEATNSVAIVAKETSTGDSIESSPLESVSLFENDQQLQVANVLADENIVIEEIYVDDWMSLERSNVPTVGIEDTFICHFPECFEEYFECDTQDGNIQRNVSGIEDEVAVTDEHFNGTEAVYAIDTEVDADLELEHNNITSDNEESLKEGELESEETAEVLHGRRIVDILWFFDGIQKLNSHSHIGRCNFSNMRFVKEHKKGLNSTFTFTCDVCQYTGTIKSNPPYKSTESNQQLEVNYASVLGAYAVGIGFYQSQEFLGTLDVPFMAVDTYDKRQKLVQEDLRELAKKVENDAMEEEKKIAVEKKEVDVNGTPLVAGFVDGSYPKRSYRTHYDSLSGTACIIGLHTKKIVWHGVKNKYCRICAVAKGEPKEHICNRNYSGPSTGIESQLLLEAFENSEKDFGVRYNKLIADGDSKTYKVIDEAKIYRNPTLKVEKIECVLHLHRCAMGLLLKIKGLSNADAEKILIGIKSSVKHWIASNLSQAEKIENIRKDILNAPHHVFGDHAKCSDYFCDKKKHLNDVNCIPEMKRSGMYNNIMQALARLLENSKSLLYNLNTNFPEQFNSVIAKHLGGKRVNFCTGLSYTGRVDCAVISFNTGRLVSHMLKYISGSKELNKNSIIYKIESARLKRRENKSKPGYLRKASKVSLPDKNYGTYTCQRPDISPEVFEMLKKIHLDSVEELQKDRTNIELRTKDEANSNFREQIQEDVLTAEKIGKICRAATDNDFPALVESIRYSSETVGNTKEIKHGRIFQNTAIELLSSILKVKIERCGLFIDNKYGFLGAHPTGLIDNNGIVLIKCPHSAFKMDINEAVDKRKITFWSLIRKRKNGNQNEARQISGVNKNHDWFFEVQALLHVTQRKFCIFVVWSGHDESTKCIKYEHLYPDEVLWNNRMEKKILNFYHNHLLPEVIDPRKRRGMPIRGLHSGNGDGDDDSGQRSTTVDQLLPSTMEIETV